ncbi:unnamed protein product [Timema podura]|uniref:Cystatin domain-containing protein n=1 Tax=Timema podura TaxID=61482 RepID=A0ABN7PDH3_TIMPD|nr:unnamed protein product [Timema podura]
MVIHHAVKVVGKSKFINDFINISASASDSKQKSIEDLSASKCGTVEMMASARNLCNYLAIRVKKVAVHEENKGVRYQVTIFIAKVKEGFGNQKNLCQDRGLSPGPSAQKSDTLPLDHQVTSTQ